MTGPQALLAGQARSAAEAVGAWLEREGYAGQDPYQLAARAASGAKSRLFSPFISLAKRAIKPFHARLPSVLFAGLSKVVIPQALGYALSGEAAAPDSTQRARRIGTLLALLDGSRSPLSRNVSWGLPFAWRDRRTYAPNWPVAYTTAVVGHALLDAADLIPRGAYEQWLPGIARFFVEECGTIAVPSGVCFRYAVEAEPPILNSSILVSAFLARAAERLGDASVLDIARRTVAFVLENQNRDGSWYYAAPYGDQPADTIIDNRHTCYVLEGLHLYGRADANNGLPVADALRRGWSYYESHLLAAGMTKWSAHEVYPVDAHDVAQAVTTMTLLGKVETAARVVEFALAKLYDGNGRFSFKLFEDGGRNRTVFIRWTQAPMYRALRLFVAAIPAA